MGCSASKLDNEDAVRRCRERRHLMKEAVKSRHQLATAHSEYLHSLNRTASALTHFAQVQPFDVSGEAPPVLLHRQYSSKLHRQPSLSPPPPPSPPRPPPEFCPSPSLTITSSKVPHILSESGSPTRNRTFPEHSYFRSNSNYASSFSQSSSPPQRMAYSKPSYFSSNSHHEPSQACSPPHEKIVQKNQYAPSHTNHPSKNQYAPSHTNYPSTPSQASSAWNWENFFPPSPSEYFRQKNLQTEDRGGEEKMREEVQYSDWGDNCHDQLSTTSSGTRSGEEADIESKLESRSASVTGSLSSKDELSAGYLENRQKFQRTEKYAVEAASVIDGATDLKMVVKHQNLVEIMSAIEEYFMKAAGAGDSVSNLLEANPAQLNQSLQKLKKRVYHSSGVFSSLSSSWTSKPPLAVRYEMDTNALAVSGDGKSHWATLERLLAWERKLCEEVKERERAKIEHEKKLAFLQSQEYKGREQAKLDKTKTSIKKLQSDIVVTSQAASTTSSAIIQIRDNELAPQLIQICYAIMNMWKTMNEYHEVQDNIVQQVRGLMNRSASGESTSDIHRGATHNLESAVSAWHSAFGRLIKFQRSYTRSIHGWLKLTLQQVDDQHVGADSASITKVASDLFAFCDEWKQSLDRAPDTVASEAINSFVRVVHSISEKQGDEMKIKKRIESTSKELEKKSTNLRNLERKFYQSYSMVGVGPPIDSGGTGNGQVFDSMDPLAEKKAELAECRRKLEDEMGKHAKAVEVTRAVTLNNIQTGLPGVFQAITAFSLVFAQSLQDVCCRASPSLLNC